MMQIKRTSTTLLPKISSLYRFSHHQKLNKNSKLTQCTDRQEYRKST